MADLQRRLILGNGEEYISTVQKASRGRRPDPPRSYEEARRTIAGGLFEAIDSFQSLPQPKRIPDEAVFCLRLHPDVTAKTYDPVELFKDSPQLRKVGSRTYKDSLENITPTKRTERIKQELADEGRLEIEGRLVFIQSSIAGFRHFLAQLDRPESNVPRGVQDELSRVERFDALRPEERLMGFGPSWKGGRAELVFHPSRIGPGEQLELAFELFEVVGIEVERSQLRPYPSGPMFASCVVTQDSLAELSNVNPLRAAHPLTFGGLTDLRSAPVARAPKPPASITKSTVKIGLFDGGVDLSVPHLAGHVEEDVSLSINSAADAQCLAHGTAVAGALLYGAINGIDHNTRLPPPPVSVVSVRALPTSDPNDVDLYESIDVIERAVPARKDIRIFNLSFGPRGPILDDTISRFTYVLDTLAESHKVTFFVAVGNDGELSGFDRIQSPADLVHGVGVGAYTINGNSHVAAPYSCRGPGRECGKVKPDVVAFGGCPNAPIHLLSPNGTEKVLAWGTSFAAPLASRIGGLAAEAFDRSSALLARGLIVHGAVHPDEVADHSLGHGIIPDDVADLITSAPDAVTVVYQSEILPRRVVKLPIPWPSTQVNRGKVDIRWTVVGLPPVDATHPSDYTTCCLEDTFYPHNLKYKFSVVGPPPKSVIRNIETDLAEIVQLERSGWSRSDYPVSESGNRYQDEFARRLDCKWEPLVRRQCRKLASSLRTPFLTLRAIGRNDHPERFDYAVIITLRARDYVGDLYSDVRAQFPALVPIRVRTEAELRVQM